jgi:endogenous inhibitor of DNA gyrase (YacG/DUF329 family)
MTDPKIKINCPNCGKKDTYHLDNPYRPFCSDRCKLIDLGEWASESRRIAGEEINPDTDSEDSQS